MLESLKYKFRKRHLLIPQDFLLVAFLKAKAAGVLPALHFSSNSFANYPHSHSAVPLDSSSIYGGFKMVLRGYPWLSFPLHASITGCSTADRPRS